MKLWKRWARRLSAAFGRRPRPDRPRPGAARVGRRIALEGLEGRLVPSAATGNVIPFAALPGTITAPATPSQVVIRFQPGQLSTIHAKPAFLGFYAQAPGTTVVPQVVGVTGPGRARRPPLRNAFGENFVTKVPAPTSRTLPYTVKVVSLNDRVGNFVVNAFLPGDVNGDGSVDAADIAQVRASLGSQAGDLRYNPAADFLHRGAVGALDLSIARQNFGAHVSYAPTAPATNAATLRTISPAFNSTPTPGFLPADPTPTRPSTLTPARTIFLSAPASTPRPTVTPVTTRPAAPSSGPVPVAPALDQTSSASLYMLTPVRLRGAAPAASSTPVLVTPVNAQPGGPAALYTLTPVR